MPRALFALPVAAGGLVWLTAASSPVRLPAEVVFNENLRPAGRLSRGVLTVSLEIRTATWHPLGPTKPGIELLAFNEVGKSPEFPGPLLRVPAGTAMHVRVTNAADTVMVVHGLSARGTATADSLVVAPGTTGEARFVADAEGTSYYWAAKAGTAYDDRMYEDAQLHGALIVDPAGRRSAADRVLVIGRWVPIINPALVFHLVRDSVPVRWRPLAKDGHDLPPGRDEARAARQPVSMGETYDFELTSPNEPAYLSLEARSGGGTLFGRRVLRVVQEP